MRTTLRQAVKEKFLLYYIRYTIKDIRNELRWKLHDAFIKDRACEGCGKKLTHNKVYGIYDPGKHISDDYKTCLCKKCLTTYILADNEAVFFWGKKRFIPRNSFTLTADIKPHTLTQGYQPRGTIPKVIDGKAVQIPISQLIIKPPQGGTGAITPLEKQTADSL